jgi:hypothetical protein
VCVQQVGGAQRGGLPLSLRVLGRQRGQVVPEEDQILEAAWVSKSSLADRFSTGSVMMCIEVRLLEQHLHIL